ncbi:MAG: hypothetical protein HYZ34_10375 [Ignavibacteriae bacterium]|nr:hypothetical protein [Ignavibacteriota bacterium]
MINYLLSKVSPCFLLLISILFSSCNKDSTTEPVLHEDITLEPPPVGKGVQVGIPPFLVTQGQEIQRDYYVTLPSDQDIFINKIEFRFNEGSHHCNVFKSDSITKTHGTFDDSFISLNYNIWDMFCASQRESLTWQMPEGVAIKLKAHQQICIQSHYVNASTQSTPNSRGKVLINFWTIPESTVISRAGLLFASNTRIIIPPHDSLEVRKFVKEIPWDIHILTLTGHFHSRGRNFWAKRFQTDEEIYRNTAWDEPPIKIFPDPGYFLYRNERIVYYSDYFNPTNDTVKMGPHVELEEHSNLFLTFYPGPADGKTIYDVDQGW